MTTATRAINNATDADAPQRPDRRRITEADADFQRLHAQTVRRLLASLRAYVRALRGSPASDHPQLATAFIHRQVGILRAAYAAAHREGVRDYCAAFSRKPGRWLHLAPQLPAPHTIKSRLGFYAPSVAKMAHEALVAWGRERSAATAAAATLSEVRHQPAHTGVMVAFMLAPQAAEQLAIAGGEPPEELHITLAFLGEKSAMSRAQIEQLKRAVAGFAAEAMPLRGRITGVDRFPGQPDDDTYPCFAAVDVPGIQRWRAALVQRLKADGLPVDETFRDYHPHITLAYVPKGDAAPAQDVPHLPLVLNQLTLALGDERLTWTVGDEQHPNAAAAASANLAEKFTKTITLAGEGGTSDFLDGIGNRVNLQSEITWSGFNDGYVDAGGSDPANPYTLLWWDLEPMARHCADCPVYAAGSPYDPPWVKGGNQLDATPGDGHTECGAGCKCGLRYGAGAGVGGPDPRGTVWDSPNAPPSPPDTEGQPQKWPNIAGVDDMSTLPEAQQQALQESFDAYRQAFERWEAIRGTLPSLPDMFGVAGGEGTAVAAWPEWESLSPAQQVALRAVFDALAAYDVAAGLPTEEEVHAGLQSTADQLQDLLDRAQEMQQETQEFLQAARDEQMQTQIDLFAGGPLKYLWQRFIMGLDDWIDWQMKTIHQMLGMGDGSGGEGGDEFADAADADTRRFYNPNHVPAGSRQGGQFAPKGGGGGGGGDGEGAGRGHSTGSGGGGSAGVHTGHAGGGGAGRESAETTVTYAGEAHRAHLAAKFGGREPTADELAGLTGSPRGSQIHVHGSEITSTHPDGSTFTIHLMGRAADGDLSISLVYRRDAEGHELSYHAAEIRQMAETAQKLGITDISTKSRRFTDDPIRLTRYGFDCPIKEALHESRYNPSTVKDGFPRAPTPPHSLLAAHTLSGALVHADARAWEEQWAIAPHLDFVNTPGSVSRQRLDAAVAAEETQGMADSVVDEVTRRLLEGPTSPERDYSQPDNAWGFRTLTPEEEAEVLASWVKAFGPIPPWPAWAGVPEPTDEDDDEGDEGESALSADLTSGQGDASE